MAPLKSELVCLEAEIHYKIDSFLVQEKPCMVKTAAYNQALKQQASDVRLCAASLGDKEARSPCKPDHAVTHRLLNRALSSSQEEATSCQAKQGQSWWDIPTWQSQLTISQTIVLMPESLIGKPHLAGISCTSWLENELQKSKPVMNFLSSPDLSCRLFVAAPQRSVVETEW